MIFTSVEENKQKTLPSLSQKMVPKEQHFQRTQYNSGGEKKNGGGRGLTVAKNRQNALNLPRKRSKQNSMKSSLFKLRII